MGGLLEIVGIVGVGLVDSTDTGGQAIAPLWFLYGVGVGLATAQLTGVIMVDVPMEKTGQGSGSQSTVRQIGSALGIAVIGTMLFTGTESSLQDRLDEIGVPVANQAVIVEAVVDSAGAVIPQISGIVAATGVDTETADSIGQASGEAFTDGAQLAAYAAAGFLVLGFLSTFRLGGLAPEPKPAGQSKGQKN